MKVLAVRLAGMRAGGAMPVTGQNLGVWQLGQAAGSLYGASCPVEALQWRGRMAGSGSRDSYRKF